MVVQLGTTAALTFPIALVTIGGVLAGAFAFPMKLVKTWEWENVWFVYSLFAFVAIPEVALIVMVPGFLQSYRHVPFSCLAGVMIAGYAWGWGNALFGVGLRRLGMGLGFCLIMGTMIVLGTLAPLALPGVAPAHWWHLLPGLVSMTVGITMCGRAGSLRSEANRDSISGSYLGAIVICLIAGCLSAAFNFGAAEARPIQQAALSEGAQSWAAANAFWPLLLFGGFLGNATYCCILFARKRSFSKLWTAGSANWLICFSMGLIWVGGVMFYAAGTFPMGASGTVVGWPIFTGATVLTSYLLGLAMGEWRGALSKSVLWMNCGVSLIIASVFLLARGI